MSGEEPFQEELHWKSTIGFPPELSNSIFLLSRSVGMIAHAHEEQARMRPRRYIHPTDWEYDGPPERELKRFAYGVRHVRRPQPDIAPLMSHARWRMRWRISCCVGPDTVSREETAMAVGTYRFRVTSVRPAASIQYEGVPQELLDQMDGKVITAGDMEELGADVKTANLHHGGDGLIVIHWHGNEYVLNLEPVSK